MENAVARATCIFYFFLVYVHGSTGFQECSKCRKLRISTNPIVPEPPKLRKEVAPRRWESYQQ
jgi:hypothetical protein